MIVSLALVVLVAVGITSRTFFSGSSNSRSLSVWEGFCNIAYFSPSRPSAFCSVPLKTTKLPASFTMSSVAQSGEGGTVRQYYFGVVLVPHELVEVSMNSSAPVDFHIYLDNRTGYDGESLSSEVLYYGHLVTNLTDITSYENQLMFSGGGLYIFELSVVQPRPIAIVEFNLQRLTNLP